MESMESRPATCIEFELERFHYPAPLSAPPSTAFFPGPAIRCCTALEARSAAASEAAVPAGAADAGTLPFPPSPPLSPPCPLLPRLSPGPAAASVDVDRSDVDISAAVAAAGTASSVPSSRISVEEGGPAAGVSGVSGSGILWTNCRGRGLFFLEKRSFIVSSPDV